MEFSKLQVAEYPTWQSRKGEQWATISSPPPKWSTLNPAPNPVRIPPNRKDLNGSGNSFRWTEVFGPFRVHKYCPKIVLWQRPQSYLEVQNLLCKKNKEFTISAKNILNSFLMENPTFIPWCGNNSIFTTGSPLFSGIWQPQTSTLK